MDKENGRNRGSRENLDETQMYSFKEGRDRKDGGYFPEQSYDDGNGRSNYDYDDYEVRGTRYDDIYKDDYYAYEKEEGEFYSREPDSLRNGGPAKSRQASTGRNKNNTSKPRAGSVKRTASSAGRKPTQKKKKGVSRNQYIAFYLVTLIVAVAICITVFFAVFNMVSGKDGGKSPDNNDFSSDVAEDNLITATNEFSTLGMVNAKNTGSNSIEVYDIENMKTTVFAVDSNTVMKSRTGEVLTFSDFNVGDIVDCRYHETGSVLNSMTMSSKAWEQRSITNARINLDNKTIVWGNESYTYTDQLKVIYNGIDYNIAQIETNNVITMRGMDKTVWYIEVNKGVGILELVNADDIKEGVVEFEGASSVTFDGSNAEDRRIKVLEGEHKVTIKGSNIEDYVADVFVESGQTTTLDLKDVEVVAGILNITVNVSDAVITVDEKIIRSNEPQVLNYGTHIVKVQHEDYESHEETVEINSTTKDINITLKEKIKFSKIEITSDPVGAEVYIDDAYIGITPVTAYIDMESSSRRQLTVKKEGYTDTPVSMTTGQEKYKIILSPAITNETDSFLSNYYNNNSGSNSDDINQ